jgi:hypothetical protein
MSNEMFYIDKDGKKADADLHKDMLDGVKIDREAAIKLAIRLGSTRASAERLFPPN